MKYKMPLMALILFTPFVSHTDSLISFFFKPYPHLFPQEYAHEIENKLQKPGKIARDRLHRQYAQNIVSGIFSIYGGFIDISDINGQTSFPLKHEKFKGVILVVTTKMTPIMMAGNTIAHWELEEGTPAALYTVEKKEDEKTKLFYWEVTERPYPKDRVIPLEGLIIIARPKDIYVPLGASLARKSPHLILPDVYVKKEIKKISLALYILNLKQFFGPVTYLYQRQRKRYATHVTH